MEGMRQVFWLTRFPEVPSRSFVGTVVGGFPENIALHGMQAAGLQLRG
jgi:hypothetical protein